MRPLDGLILVILAVLIIASIRNMIKRKNFGCSCGCRDCTDRICDANKRK